MRIAFVTNNYTPYSGGVVSSIQATVDELQKQGHELCVITLSFLPSHDTDPKWVHRIPSLVRFRYKQNYCAIPWRSSSYVQRLLERFNPDVVHVHHPFLLGTAAVQWAKKYGVKTVFTHHTVYAAYSHYVPLIGPLTRPFIQPYVARFCMRVDQIIAPSHAVKELLYQHRVLNVQTLPSGIQSAFTAQPFMNTVLKKPYQLLHVGRFTSEKNIPLLFEVMKYLPPEYQLTLVGYGAETDRLMQLAYTKYGFSKERVRFVIKPTKNDLIMLYNRAHFFTFSSHTDTQGLVLAESMACSTPVIAFDGPGQRDIINGLNGKIVPNVQAMADVLQTVGPQQYETMQRGAYETSRNYGVQQTVTKLVELYHALFFLQENDRCHIPRVK